eukprot:4241845-Prymnesium_polylepis.2
MPPATLPSPLPPTLTAPALAATALAHSLTPLPSRRAAAGRARAAGGGAGGGAWPADRTRQVVGRAARADGRARAVRVTAVKRRARARERGVGRAAPSTPSELISMSEGIG